MTFTTTTTTRPSTPATPEHTTHQEVTSTAQYSSSFTTDHHGSSPKGIMDFKEDQPCLMLRLDSTTTHSQSNSQDGPILYLKPRYSSYWDISSDSEQGNHHQQAQDASTSPEPADIFCSDRRIMEVWEPQIPNTLMLPTDF